MKIKLSPAELDKAVTIMYSCDNESCEDHDTVMSWHLSEFGNSGSPICGECGDDMVIISGTITI